MTYETLKEIMVLYHQGKITKLDMGFAIALWQAGCNAKGYGAE